MDDQNQVPTNETSNEVPAKDIPKKPVTKKKSKVGLIIGIVVAVLLVIGLLIGWGVMTVMNTANAPAKTSSELISDIQTNKSTEAYNLLSNETKSNVTQEEFSQLVNQIGPILNGTPKTVNKQIQTNNGKTTATVTYEIAGSDNKTYTIKVDLAKNDGVWQVVEFNSTEK